MSVQVNDEEDGNFYDALSADEEMDEATNEVVNDVTNEAISSHNNNNLSGNSNDRGEFLLLTSNVFFSS
jgi:hypothetical protein